MIKRVMSSRHFEKMKGTQYKDTENVSISVNFTINQITQDSVYLLLSHNKSILLLI